MATRSVIVITGAGRYKTNETIRLYKHWDGYPTGNLPIIAAGIKDALAVWSVQKDAPGANPLTTGLLTGKLIGAATDESGMGAVIDSDYKSAKDVEYQTPAVYSGKFKKEFLGEHFDVEWYYLVDVNSRSVNVYTRTADLNNPTDPVSYVKQLYDQYQLAEAREIRKAVQNIESLGFSFNKGFKYEA